MKFTIHNLCNLWVFKIKCQRYSVEWKVNISFNALKNYIYVLQKWQVQKILKLKKCLPREINRHILLMKKDYTFLQIKTYKFNWTDLLYNLFTKLLLQFNFYKFLQIIFFFQQKEQNIVPNKQCMLQLNDDQATSSPLSMMSFGLQIGWF